jgi:hypothetical protein
MPIDNDDLRYRPAGYELRERRRSAMPYIWITLLVALVAAAAWWWLRPVPAAPPADTRVVAAPLTPPEPAVRYPLEEAPPPADFAAALRDLLGARAVSRFIETTDFPRRFVATVDNLGREQAPQQLWPVKATPGRFSTQQHGETVVLADANAARYHPFVQLAEQVDPGKAIELYRSIYPQLQAAYEQQGFKDRYFNDRMVEVIDQLLATPEPDGPVPLRQIAIQGPMGDPRPWVRWEYADPRLQSLSAGQKAMLRTGLQNEQRLKRVLQQWRAELVRGGTPAR